MLDGPDAPYEVLNMQPALSALRKEHWSVGKFGNVPSQAFGSASRLVVTPSVCAALLERQLPLPKRVDIISYMEDIAPTLVAALEERVEKVGTLQVRFNGLRSRHPGVKSKIVVIDWDTVFDRILGGRNAELPVIFSKHKHPIAQRLNELSEGLELHDYLQIGHQHGRIFGDVDLQRKAILDTEFLTTPTPFLWEPHRAFEMAPDDFFMLAHQFDPIELVFVHGNYSVEEVLRWMRASVAKSGTRAVWVFDHVIPRDNAEAGEERRGEMEALFDRIPRELPIFRGAGLVGVRAPLAVFWKQPRLSPAPKEGQTAKKAPRERYTVEELCKHIQRGWESAKWSAKRTLADRRYLEQTAR